MSALSTAAATGCGLYYDHCPCLPAPWQARPFAWLRRAPLLAGLPRLVNFRAHILHLHPQGCPAILISADSEGCSNHSRSWVAVLVLEGAAELHQSLHDELRQSFGRRSGGAVG